MSQAAHTQAEPFLITTFSADGPVLGLDLEMVPRQVLERIAARALSVESAWQNGEITTDCIAGKVSLECLSIAADALDQFSLPIVPPAQELAAIGMRFDPEGASFPVIRSGEIVQIGTAELSPIELAAVRSWLQHNAATVSEQSTIFQRRLEQFDRERMAARGPQPTQI